jgi:hydrophobic/amphiphilic exporter-1 (mainly G- bacteria), HAE1 family
MNISTFAVHRPVMSTMAALIVIIIGLVSLWRLAIDLMPDVTYPTLSVSTEYSNASPEEVEELITRPWKRPSAPFPVSSR